jgi:hypothetical protein
MHVNKELFDYNIAKLKKHSHVTFFLISLVKFVDFLMYVDFIVFHLYNIVHLMICSSSQRYKMTMN